MDLQVRFHQVARTSLALAMLTASAAASAALTQFTWNPAAVGLAGTAFTADNLLITDFATVRNGSAGSFNEEGFLSITGAQLNNNTISPAGLNTAYGFYIQFTASGTSTAANPLATPTVGSFTSLDYTLYGYNGSASFGFSGSTPTTTAVAPVALASGSLLSGNLATFPTGGTFVAFANADVSFNVLVQSLFQSPSPFSSTALTSFTNTSSEVSPFEDATGRGFMIMSGGGSINFASPVPEPTPLAMLLAGLGTVGFLARRRRS